MSEDDVAAIEALNWVEEHMGGYEVLQSKQPQTLAHALADSPVGLLGWHAQIYRGSVDADFVLTNVMIYWLTGTVASSMRFYYEADKAGLPAKPTTIPVGLAQFADDFKSIRRQRTNSASGDQRWSVRISGMPPPPPISAGSTPYTSRRAVRAARMAGPSCGASNPSAALPGATSTLAHAVRGRGAGL